MHISLEVDSEDGALDIAIQCSGCVTPDRDSEVERALETVSLSSSQAQFFAGAAAGRSFLLQQL